MQRGYQDWPISAYNQVPLFCLMCVPMFLRFRVIQDFVQKAIFSEKQLVVGGLTMVSDRGINTIVNHGKSALDFYVII